MRQFIGSVVALFPLFVNAFTWQTLSTTFYFTKRIAPGIFSGGWPTEQDIRSLANAGFKSILSTSFNKDGVEEFNGVQGTFLSCMHTSFVSIEFLHVVADDEVALATSLGMEAQYISASFTKASVERVSSAIHSMPKPVFIHCHVCHFSSSSVIFSIRRVMLPHSLPSCICSCQVPQMPRIFTRTPSPWDGIIKPMPTPSVLSLMSPDMLWKSHLHLLRQLWPTERTAISITFGAIGLGTIPGTIWGSPSTHRSRASLRQGTRV